MQLHWHSQNAANPARYLAGLGRIFEKWPDSGFAGAEPEIRHNPRTNRETN